MEGLKEIDRWAADFFLAERWPLSSSLLSPNGAQAHLCSLRWRLLPRSAFVFFLGSKT